MPKGEISWVRAAEPDGKLQVYAHRVGNQWNFFARQKRFDEWAAVPQPPLEDWLELLDGIRRRVARRLVRPEEVQRVEKVIRERFPEAEFWRRVPPSPIILISGSTEKKGCEMGDASLSLAVKYPLALKAAGGMPWLLPCIPEKHFIADAVKRCAGVLLTGGDDIDPKLYSRRLPPRVARTVQRESPERDAFEQALVEEVVRQRRPLLGICRGHQMLNVALGGTLFADIKLQLPQARDHCRTDRKSRIVHEVRCVAGSMMARIVGRERLGVNSTHHQAVARIAKPLQATAVTDDGIIEGLELAPDDRGMMPYLLSVQFHPERLFERYAEHLNLFRSFVSACSRNWRSKYEA